MPDSSSVQFGHSTEVRVAPWLEAPQIFKMSTNYRQNKDLVSAFVAHAERHSFVQTEHSRKRRMKGLRSLDRKT